MQKIMNLLVFTLVSFVQISCGQHSESYDVYSDVQRGDTPRSGYTIDPEYKSVSAVVLNSGFELVTPVYTKNLGFSSYEFRKRVRDEYEMLILSLSKGTKDVRLLIYTAVDPFEGQSISEKHVFTSEILPQIENKEVLQRDTFFPDAWTRDYIAFSATTNGSADSQKVLLTYTDSFEDQRGREVNEDIGKLLELPRSSAANLHGITGGGLMVDGLSRCFGATPYLPDLSFGCREIIGMPPLPMEGTGHIDLFAKILADDTAMVADYRDDGVVLDMNPHVTTRLCRSAGDCTIVNEEKVYPPILEMGDQGNPQIFSIAELKQHVEFLYPNQAIIWPTTPSSTKPWSEFQLPEFTQQIGKKMSESGFKTKFVRSPPPIAVIEIDRIVDDKGNITQSFTSISFVYRSYLNSLTVNGSVFIPTFDTVSNTLNEDAIGAYQSLGFNVVPVSMDAHAYLGGGVHCMTHELH